MLPKTLLTQWFAGGSETGNFQALSKAFVSVSFYLVIVFSPSFGVFLTRISKSYTIREYVSATMPIPASVRFIWFAIVGTTPVDLALYSITGDSITTTAILTQRFIMLDVILSNS